jgi:hypothetical protein
MVFELQNFLRYELNSGKDNQQMCFGVCLLLSVGIFHPECHPCRTATESPNISILANCDDSTGQPVKHRHGRLLTDEGIQIDRNARQSWNAPFSIRFNLDPDSNVTDESR